MRVKTFLLRLLSSVRFWLLIAVLFFSYFAVGALLSGKPLIGESMLFGSSADIDVTIDASGDATITDKRTFDTSGVASYHTWEWAAIKNKEVAIRCVDEPEQVFSIVNFSTISSDKASDLNNNQIIERISQSGERAVRDGGDRLFVFLPEDRRCTVTIVYTESDVVRLYTDGAAARIGIDFTPSPVTVALHLPMPEDGNIKDSIFYSSEPSSVATAQDNTIVAKIDHSAYVGVLFPRHWVDERIESYAFASSKSDFSAPYGMEKVPFSDGISTENTTSRGSMNVLFGIAFVIVLGAGFFAAYMVRKKKKDEIFSERYWRDVPDKDLDPVIVGRLWAHNSEAQAVRDVPTIVMTLINKGAVTLKKRGGDSELRRVSEPKATLSSIDTQALDIIFDKHKSVKLSELIKRQREITGKVNAIVDKQLAKEEKIQDHPVAVLLAGGVLTVALVALIANFFFSDFDVFRYLPALIGWFSIGTVATIFIFPEVSFAKGSKKTSWPFWLLAFIAIVTALILNRVTPQPENAWPVVMCELLTIAFVVFGFYAARRSARIENIVAKADGLKNWLEDFTLLDERPPSDVKVWGEFMVYATAFGIADKVDKELDGLELSLFDDSILYSLGRFAKEKIFADNEK